MSVKIEVSGFDEKECLSLKDERKGILASRRLLLSKVMEGERENVMLRLMGRFKMLRYEDLEEIYSDGCLVLWKRMNEEGFKLEEKSMVGYLVRACKNIGMHYLRKVNEDVVSLNVLWDNGGEKDYDEEDGMKRFFDVLDERGGEDEMLERLDRAWERLKDVDKMILECYYVDGCRMEEVARRVGYRNADSVKSRKNKVIRKLMEMMKEEEADASSSFIWLLFLANLKSDFKFTQISCKFKVQRCVVSLGVGEN